MKLLSFPTDEKRDEFMAWLSACTDGQPVKPQELVEFYRLWTRLNG